MKNKFEKSIVGMNFGSSKILFVMLNPKWTSFDSNYDYVVSVTSGAGAQRFNNLWYGQPVNFGKYITLLEQLNVWFKC